MCLAPLVQPRGGKDNGEAVTSQKWVRVKDLFSELAETSPAERESLLNTVDRDLRGELERLLAHHDAVESQGSLFAQNTAGGFQLLESVLAAQVFEAGTLLAGRFEVVHPIGSGGMGEVYEAFDRELREAVAIKTIRLGLAIDPEIVERFKREVLHSRKVTHPNVCRVYDFFSARAFNGSEVPFFTMELLHGTTLLEYVREHGRLPIADALPIALQICDALSAAHRRGILHRDLKSANVFLARGQEESRPTAKITDFGLARLLSAQQDAGSADPVQAASGTPPYMAPELIDRGSASAASDIFSLGVILHRMVLGRYPGAASADDPDLPGGWDAAIKSCLAADPLSRPRDAAQVAALLSGRPLARWSDSARTRIDRLSRRQLVAGTTAMFGLAAIGIEETIRRWPRPPFANRQWRALVEEFQSQDAGGALGRSVRSMIRIALSQATNVRLVSPDRIEKAAVALDLGALPIRGDNGRRVAVKTGADVAIGGRVRSDRGRYVVEAQARRASSGELLFSTVDGAATLRDLAPAVERISAQLVSSLSGREAKPSPNPSRLEPADTLMPDALEMFTSGLDYYQHGDMKSALAMLQSATRRDPDFAMAYVYQAYVHGAFRREDLAFEPAARAYSLRDRVNQRQRLQAEVMYSYACGDYEGYRDKQRALIAIYPNEAQLHRSLAQTYAFLGNLEDALRHARLSVELGAEAPQTFMILAGVLTESGRTAEALQVISRARKSWRESPLLLLAEGSARIMEG